MGRDRKRLGAGYVVKSFRPEAGVFRNGRGKIGDRIFGNTSGRKRE